MASCLLHWAVCLLPLALFTGRSAYYTLLGALCFEADAQGRLVSIGSCPLPLTFAYGLMSAALDLIAHTSCMPQSAACASSLLPVAVRPLTSIAFAVLLCLLLYGLLPSPLWPATFCLSPVAFCLHSVAFCLMQQRLCVAVTHSMFLRCL